MRHVFISLFVAIGAVTGACRSVSNPRSPITQTKPVGVEDSGNAPAQSNNVSLTFVVDDGPLDGVDEANVTLDGLPLPNIEPDATLTFYADPGEHDLAVLHPFRWAGREQLLVPEAGVLDTTVVLSSGRLSSYLDYELVIETAEADDVVPMDGDLAFSFRQPDGTPITVERTGAMRFAPILPGSFTPGVGGLEVRRALVLDPDAAALEDGVVVVSNPGAVFDVLLRTGETEFSVLIEGQDNDLGVTLVGVARMRIGAHSLTGTLRLTSGGSVDQREIQLLDATSRVTRTAITDALGVFEFLDLPAGPYTVTTTVQDDPSDVRAAHGQITLHDAASRSVVLTPLSPAERVEGLIDEVVVDGKSRPPMRDAVKVAAPRILMQDDCASRAFSAVAANVTYESATVVEDSVAPVPADVETVALVYQVVTSDIPEFMSRPSEPLVTAAFENPGYIITVYDAASGQELHRVARNLRDHRSGPHVLMEDVTQRYIYRTHWIVEVIEVPKGTTQIGLFVLLDSPERTISTSVVASLTTKPVLLLSYDATGQDALPAASVPYESTVIPSTNGLPPDLVARNAIPLPLEVGVEVWQASEPFTWDLTTGMEVVRAQGAGMEDVTIMSIGGIDASSRDPVQTIGTDRFAVRVDHGRPNPSSELVGDVSNLPRIVDYAVRLRAQIDACDVDEEVHAQRLALWSGILDSEPRTGGFDRGGDDWASPRTIQWLIDHRQLLGPAIGDISGEHGSYIEHKTHKFGGDIDFRQYGDYSDAEGDHLSGGAVYSLVQRDAVRAMGGDSAARERLADFIRLQREGLDQLMTNAWVERLIGPEGEAAPPLRSGWLVDLMLRGTTRHDQTGTALDLGLESWAPSKPYSSNMEHDNHFHVSLHQVAY